MTMDATDIVRPSSPARQSAPSLDVVRNEVAQLIRKKDFSQARRRLTPILRLPGLSPEDRLWVRQKMALCTYKDAELQAEDALERALALLTDADGGEDLATTTNHETLSLAGAIHKRLWEVSGDGRSLRRSLVFYRRAREHSTRLEDWTYAAVNLALVFDLVAREELVEDDEGSRTRAGELRVQAEAERRSVIAARDDILAGTGVETPWWPRATLVEACFGLGNYAEAATLLETARRECQPDDWQLETLIRQLAALARLHERRGEDIGPAFEALWRDNLDEGARRSG